jgi:hypothetical protein
MGKQQEKKAAPAPDELFVFGVDEIGKARGARFAEFNSKIVTAAAEMKLTSVHPASAAFAQIGTKLPAGRLYASGKAFVPPIRRDLHEKLKAALAAPGDESQAHGPLPADEAKESNPGPAAAGGLPRSWDSIDVGHVVLVDDSPEYGWWPCIVLNRDDQVLTLRLRDYPNKGTYVRNIAQVALINPGPV